jgi:hypothetical protein
MHRWLTAGHTVTLLNVFTRSLHAPYSDADFVHENDRLSYVSAMRLREDELFVQRITHELPRNLKTHLSMLDLNLKDAPIRLRCDNDAVCNTPVNPEDPAIEKIRRALTRQAEAGNIDALILPLALGGHVDHLTVREAAIPFTAGQASAFYEDLPYAAALNGFTTLHSLPAENTPDMQDALTPVLCKASEAFAFKRHLVLAYPSQIDETEANVIADFAVSYDGAERLWANAAWLAIAGSAQLSILQS